MNRHLEKIIILSPLLFSPLYLVKINLGALPFNLLEFLILISFFTAFARKGFDIFQISSKKNSLYLFSIFLIFIGLLESALLSGNLRTGFGIIKSWFIFPLIFLFALGSQTKSRKDISESLKLIYISISFAAIISLLYFLAGILTYDLRLRAFYESPNQLAMFLVPGIFIGFYFIKSKIEKYELGITDIEVFAKFLFILIFLVAILASLFLTYSYSSWISVLLSFFLIFFLTNKLSKDKFKLSLIFILILCALFLTQIDSHKFKNALESPRSSIRSRIMIWNSSAKIIRDNPAFGIGPGNFQKEYLDYQKYFPPYLEWAVTQPHNLYLAFWLQGGIFGLIGFLLLAYFWLGSLFKKIRQKNSFFGLEAVLAGIMLYILIVGLLDTPVWKNDLALVFSAIVFLGIKLDFYRV